MKNLILCAALLLAGCAKSPEADLQRNYVRYAVAGFPALEFQLTDGTRCVLFREGVTCDWQRPVVLVPQVQ